MDIGIMLATVAGTLVIGAILAPFMYHFGKKIGFSIMARFFGLVDVYVKDKKLNSEIKGEIIRVQKQMGDGKGKEKLDAVKSFARSIIPGGLDDVLIEKIVQGIYDGVVEAK